MISGNGQSKRAVRIALSKEARYYLLLALSHQHEFETKNGFCSDASDEIARIIAWADGD